MAVTRRIGAGTFRFLASRYEIGKMKDGNDAAHVIGDVFFFDSLKLRDDRVVNSVGSFG